MASIHRHLAINTVIQVAGKALATVLGVITLGVLTRLLAPQGYGDLTLILVYISVFASLVDFGLTITTVQMISEDKADESRIIGNLISLRTVSAFLFLALAPIIALAFPYSIDVKIGIAISALSYFLFANSQLLVGIFQKRFVIWQPTLAEVLNRATVLAGILLVPAGLLSLQSVLWIFVLGNIVHLALTVLFAVRHLSFKPRFELVMWGDIVSRSWPVGLSILFNLIYLRGDILFMSFTRSSEEIGLYGAAYKVVDVMTTIPVTFMGLLLPVLTLAVSQGRMGDFHKFMRVGFDQFMMIAVGFVFGTLALAEPVMVAISGEAFSESGAVLKILGLASAIVFFGSLFGHAILAVQKQRMMTIGYALVALVTIIAYLIFIPRYGMYGAAWITVASELLITGATAFVIYKETRFMPHWSVGVKSLLAGIVMYVALHFLIPHSTSIETIIAIGAGCALYSALLLSFGAINPSALKALLTR